MADIKHSTPPHPPQHQDRQPGLRSKTITWRLMPSAGVVSFYIMLE
ncbi:hypothetical protein Mettu_0009 [Methylobacter tundripaludum SV96]|jgi:hypothetical protein|uniref:Uncharacterized protein n=1 Tax=Methylobacter tundripaludum (strain ATCC BAA-1195 / DSM 17260 / SV96) TaxID=697282 RepID=G3ISP2_METTV|nr:hypothetical protein Mettu_0009 [Methylobacter tundripaludum SV96]